MKKTLITLIFLTNYCFGAVVTTDIYVMKKDATQAANFGSQMVGTMKDIKSKYDQLQNTKTLADGITQFNSLDSRKFCPECSDATIDDLEKWKKAVGKNWCEEFNNHLGLIQGHIKNVGDMQNFITALSTASATKDPALVMSAFQSAQTTTLSELNATQQQMAAYAMEKDRKNEVDEKISKMKANKAMYGVTCPECIGK